MLQVLRGVVANRKAAGVSNTEVLAEQFKQWRRETKISLRDLEPIVGLSNAFLNQFENGKVGIDYENALKIQKLVGKSKINLIRSLATMVLEEFPE